MPFFGSIPWPALRAPCLTASQRGLAGAWTSPLDSQSGPLSLTPLTLGALLSGGEQQQEEEAQGEREQPYHAEGWLAGAAAIRVRGPRFTSFRHSDSYHASLHALLVDM